MGIGSGALSKSRKWAQVRVWQTTHLLLRFNRNPVSRRRSPASMSRLPRRGPSLTGVRVWPRDGTGQARVRYGPEPGLVSSGGRRSRSHLVWERRPPRVCTWRNTNTSDLIHTVASLTHVPAASHRRTPAAADALLLTCEFLVRLQASVFLLSLSPHQRTRGGPGPALRCSHLSVR